MLNNIWVTLLFLTIIGYYPYVDFLSNSSNCTLCVIAHENTPDIGFIAIDIDYFDNCHHKFGVRQWNNSNDLDRKKISIKRSIHIEALEQKLVKIAQEIQRGSGFVSSFVVSWEVLGIARNTQV